MSVITIFRRIVVLLYGAIDDCLQNAKPVSSFLIFSVASLYLDFRCLIHVFSEFSFVRLDTWSLCLQQVMITLLEINTCFCFGVGANLKHNGFSGRNCSDL